MSSEGEQRRFRAAQSESEGEDLIGDNMMDDYQRMPELDRYDARDLDAREYQGMTYEERRDAEKAMADRDVRGGRRVPAALAGDDDDFIDVMARRERLRRMEGAAIGERGDDMEFQEDVPLSGYDVPVREYLAEERVRQTIKRRFKHYLQTANDEAGVSIYKHQIDEMTRDNKQSLEVSYVGLSRMDPDLAAILADGPKDVLEAMSEVAKEVVALQYPDYSLICDEIFVRIVHLPINDSLRDLRQIHLGQLIKVSGVVTRRTGMFPQLKVMRFNCGKCGAVSQPIAHNSEQPASVGPCNECQSKGPFYLNTEHTVYRNYQKITLQESPSAVPAGRVPRYKEVVLLGDLIDSARPGEEVDITGIYTNSYDASLNSRQGFPVFATVIEANYVEKRQDALAGYHLTDDDKRQVQSLASDPAIGERIIKSIAPSIYGNEHVKTAAAMAMFGGQEKNVKNKHRVRGDINVLLMGDPGTAKSQVLKYVEQTAPRAVYTTGKGASAVGLTAAVHRDNVTGEWTLEGGALVLADRGVCLIDEFDKMNDADRTSIHEAMEQQSISISKAGIVTSLQARCSVMAAANPIGGRYDASKTFSENVHLTDPILQRFDILCVLQDTVDPVADEQLARFVVSSHIRSHPDTRRAEDLLQEHAEAGAGDGAPEDVQHAIQAAQELVTSVASLPQVRSVQNAIDQALLRKYIVYSRTYVRPKLTNINQDKVSSLYAKLRKESEISDGVPVAVRHIESIMRMSEAHARMHLREFVADEDVDVAIRVMLESFINAQKFAVRKSLRRSFKQYLTYKRDFNDLLLFALQELMQEQQALDEMKRQAAGAALPDTLEVTVGRRELEDKAQSYGITDLQSFLESPQFISAGFKLSGRTRIIKTVY